MPDPINTGRRPLTPEEQRRLLGGLADVEPAATEETPQEAGPRQMRPGMLPYLGALGTRLAGGLISGIVGAVPTPVTTPAAAAIGGLGEYAAQKIESPDDVDKSTIALESGLSAVPLGWIFRELKAGTPIARQIVSNMVRGAGLNEAGNMARRYNERGEILPSGAAETLSDLGTSAIGAGFGYLGAKPSLKKIQEAGGANVPLPVNKEAELMAALTSGGKPVDTELPSNLVTLAKGRKSGTASAETRPTGLRVKPNAPAENPNLAVTGREVVNPVQNARTIEEPAPIPGVINKQESIAARPATIHPDLLDADRVARRPEAVGASLSQAAKNASDMADVQLKAGRLAQREEARLAKAEQSADLQDMRNRGTGPNQEKVQQLQERQAKQKAAEAAKVEKEKARLQAESEKQARTEAAARRIEELKSAGELEKGETIGGTSEKVPTETGHETLKTFYRKAEPEAGGEKVTLDNPNEAAPVNPSEIPRTDPTVVASTTYSTKQKAMDALSGTGRRGVTRPLGRGKWQVILEGEQGAPRVEPPSEAPLEAPPVAPAPEPKEPPPAALAGEAKSAPVVAEPQAPAKEFTPGVPAEEIPPQVKELTAKLRAALDEDAARRAAKEVPPEAPPAPPVEPPAAPVPVAPKPTPKAPKGGATAEAPKMSRAEIDATTREDVAKWTDAEIAQAQGKYPKDKRLQTILTDELAKRQKAPEAPQTPTRGAVPVAPQKSPVEAPKAVPEAPKASGFEGPDRNTVTPEPEKTATGVPKTELKPGSKNAYEQMAQEASTPEGAVTVDLTGAQTGGEVRNRVVNELHKYRSEVKASEDARGVDEKGQYTYPVPIPKPRTIVVPGGPSYTFQPDLQQIDNAISAFEKGATVKGAHGRVERAVRIEPEDAFKGIVDETPKNRTVTVKPGYGTSFKAKEGSAPSYKLPVGPEKPTVPVKGRPSSGPSAEAPKETVPKVEAKRPLPESAAKEKIEQGKAETLKKAATEPKAEGVPTTKDGSTKAQILEKHGLDKGMDSNDLALEQQKAADEYFRIKEQYKLDGNPDTYTQLRAAGQKLGELKAATVLAAKEEGVKAPAAVEPAKVKEPNGKGKTLEELAQMEPAAQEAEIRKAVEEFKATKGKKPSKGKGTIVGGGFGSLQEFYEKNPGLFNRLGLGTAGAIAGAAATPDHPLVGGMLGASAGLYAPSVFRAMQGYVNKLPANEAGNARQALGNFVWDKVKTVGEVLPDVWRASLLSKPPNLIMNIWAGPYGSAVMSALEHYVGGTEGKDASGALKELLLTNSFFKEWYASRRAAQSAVSHANERAEIAGVGPAWLRKLTSMPANEMTAGDIAGKAILEKHGWTHLEAQEATLTSEPQWPINKSISNARKTKGANGKQSIILSTALPFYRTNANQLEQSIERLPIFGPIVRSVMKKPEQALKLTVAQNLISTGAMGVGYYLGANIQGDAKHKALWLKFINNFGGQYGISASIGFAMGAARAQNKDIVDQAQAAGLDLLKNGMTLPNPDVLVAGTKAISQALHGENPDLPYGVVPPPISSKEFWSIPTAQRYLSGDKNADQPTKKEYSVFAPLVHNPKLKPKPKTPVEQRMVDMKTRMAKYRKAQRDRVKEALGQE